MPELSELEAPPQLFSTGTWPDVQAASSIGPNGFPCRTLPIKNVCPQPLIYHLQIKSALKMRRACFFCSMCGSKI